MDAPGLDEVLCWPFRTDNSGPPADIYEVIDMYNIVQAQFPGAEVWHVCMHVHHRLDRHIDV